ncbi:hypothetical protein [Arthrobacter methylotrophus]|uniref:Polynucleotide kinase PNKP phosphatase domain-containing protein n=1 Tax=Arthrobacter methylotrophus TaxID=121291 RepID=A0ABV5UPB3_9MICC
MQLLPEAVIFDFGGTLVDTSTIDHLVAGHHPACDAPEADRFHVESLLCPPVRQVVRLLELERSIGRRIIIVAASRDHYRPHLQSWLDLHSIAADEIHLRQVSDHRPDALTKRELVAGVQERHHVIHAYESRPDVARAYERLGIPVTLTGGALPSHRVAAAA